MKILNISNMSVWLWGEGKGIPSVFSPQKEFAAKGHQVYFLCPLREKEEKYVCLEGVHVNRFRFPFNFRKISYLQTDTFLGRLKATVLSNLNWLFFQIFALMHGLKFGLRLKPDIIYAHSPASVISSFLVSRLVSSRLVIRLYGVRQLYWQWSHFWMRLKEIRDWFVFKIPADLFIITNDGTHGDRMARRLGVPDKKIKFWRNGIDEKIYEIEEGAKEEICVQLGIKPISKIIVSTARLNHEYGVDRLIQALPEVFEKDRECICIIAGGGPQEELLKKFAQKHNISSRVFFLGIVDRAMVKKILNAADIFVLLARYHNCTNTLWEAMACGKCIVTTQNEAIQEILVSGEVAVLVSQEGIHELPEKLMQLLSDEVLRKKLGDNARSRARQVLESWPERVAKEADLLEGLVKK
jgi:glycosyltransferase involved in cell wall biosynthesis